MIQMKIISKAVDRSKALLLLSLCFFFVRTKFRAVTLGGTKLVVEMNRIALKYPVALRLETDLAAQRVPHRV